MENELQLIDAEEKDVLQEIMNIAFGNAAAELAQVINIFVVLSVPFVRVLWARELPEYIRSEVSGCEMVSIVEQDFWGEFKGNALMVFQSGAGRELAFMLNGDAGVFEPGSTDRFVAEILMEVGNILISACVGKLAELLGDVIQYSPPRVLIENHANDALPHNLFDQSCSAIILKTMFQFNDKDIGGFLFLVTSQESIGWLKEPSRNSWPNMNELKQIFDTVNLGLVILDRDLKVRHWNRWMARCSKIAPEAILGRRIFDFFPSLANHQSFQRNCKSVLAFGSYAFFSQKLHRYLFPFPPASAFEVNFEQMQQSCTMGPLRDQDRAITGLFLTVEDMTENAANEQRLVEMNSKDVLTGVYNRRYLETRIREEFGRHRRYARRLTLVMFDIDHFKKVNDSYGHPCGDFILQSVAGAVAGRIRISDCLARYGGEEFSCLLQETDLASGRILAERFRRQVEEMEHDYKGIPVRVTISLGVAELRDEDTLEQFVKRADDAMYRAKEGGRNRVCLESPRDPEPAGLEMAARVAQSAARDAQTAARDAESSRSHP